MLRGGLPKLELLKPLPSNSQVPANLSQSLIKQVLVQIPRWVSLQAALTIISNRITTDATAIFACEVHMGDCTDLPGFMEEILRQVSLELLP
jgi:hypothetical protein